MKKQTLIMILGLAGFTVWADNWVVSPILPAIADDQGQEVTRAGLLITAYMLPFGLFQLVFGPLADRYGKRQVLAGTMLFFTVATALCAVASGFTDLTVYRALTGVFAASVMPVSMALIGDMVPLPERQAAIGTFLGIAFLGQGLSMAIGGTIAYFLSWRSVFGIYSVLAAVSTALLFFGGRHYPTAKNPDISFFAPYGRLLKNPASLRLYLIVLLQGILIIGSFSYLGAYISKTYQYNYFYIGLIMTAFGIAAMIGARMSGKLGRSLPQKNLVVSGFIIASAANGSLYFLGYQLGFLILAVTLLGFGLMLAYSTILTIATEFAAQARGAAMSLAAFCFMGGGGVGTAIGGKVIDAIGFNLFYLYCGLGLIALAALAAFWVTAHTPSGTQRSHVAT
jgi:predicted MFS family arabinose efflux permease